MHSLNSLNSLFIVDDEHCTVHTIERERQTEGVGAFRMMENGVDYYSAITN